MCASKSLNARLHMSECVDVFYRPKDLGMKQCQRGVAQSPVDAWSVVSAQTDDADVDTKHARMESER